MNRKLWMIFLGVLMVAQSSVQAGYGSDSDSERKGCNIMPNFGRCTKKSGSSHVTEGYGSDSDSERKGCNIMPNFVRCTKKSGSSHVTEDSDGEIKLKKEAQTREQQRGCLSRMFCGQKKQPDPFGSDSSSDDDYIDSLKPITDGRVQKQQSHEENDEDLVENSGKNSGGSSWGKWLAKIFLKKGTIESKEEIDPKTRVNDALKAEQVQFDGSGGQNNQNKSNIFAGKNKISQDNLLTGNESAVSEGSAKNKNLIVNTRGEAVNEEKKLEEDRKSKSDSEIQQSKKTIKTKNKGKKYLEDQGLIQPFLDERVDLSDLIKNINQKLESQTQRIVQSLNASLAETIKKEVKSAVQDAMTEEFKASIQEALKEAMNQSDIAEAVELSVQPIKESLEVSLKKQERQNVNTVQELQNFSQMILFVHNKLEEQVQQQPVLEPAAQNDNAPGQQKEEQVQQQPVLEPVAQNDNAQAPQNSDDDNDVFEDAFEGLGALNVSNRSGDNRMEEVD